MSIFKKLRSTCGETLIEALVSTMICVLAVGLLTTGMITSSIINNENDLADQNFRAGLSLAESYDGQVNSGDIIIKFPSEFTTKTVTVKVELFGEDGDFAAYRRKAESP